MADSKISALTDGSPVQDTDEFVIARSGANYKLPWAALGSSSAPGYEFAYAQKTTDINPVTATTAATAQTVATTGSVTYDGNTTLMIECYAPGWNRGTNQITMAILMDGSVIESFVTSKQFSGVEGAIGKFRYKPASGSHTFTFGVYVDAGNGVVWITGSAPAYIRITRAA